WHLSGVTARLPARAGEPEPGQLVHRLFAYPGRRLLLRRRRRAPPPAARIRLPPRGAAGERRRPASRLSGPRADLRGRRRRVTRPADAPPRPLARRWKQFGHE